MKDKTSDELDRQIETILDWINDEGLEGYHIDTAYITEEGYDGAQKRLKSLITQKVNEAERRGIQKAYQLLKPYMVRSFSTDDLIVTRAKIDELQSTNNEKDE